MGAGAILFFVTFRETARGSIFRSEDSALYLSAADNFGAFLRGKLPPSVLTRAPLYPALLAGASFGNPADATVCFVHLFLMLGGLVLFLAIIRPYAPLAAAMAAFAAVAADSMMLSSAALSEWTAIVLLLIELALVLRWCAGRSVFTLFGMSLFASLAVLTRPALGPVLLVPILCALRYSRKPTAEELHAEASREFAETPSTVFVVKSLHPAMKAARYVFLAAGFAPLVLWLAVNGVRLGVITIAPFSGISLLGVAALVGHPGDAKVSNGEMREYLALLEKDLVNPVTGSEERRYHHVIWDVSMPFWDRSTVRLSEWNRLTGRLAVPVLAGDPAGYFGHVLRQFARQAKHFDWIDFLLLVAVSVLAAKRRALLWTPHGKTLGMALLLHVLHLLVCSLTGVMLFAAFMCTWLPVRGAAILFLGCALLGNQGRKTAPPL